MSSLPHSEAPSSSLSPVSMTPPPAVEEAEEALPESWFDRRSSFPPRRSSFPPPLQAVGPFLGDPLVDAWLR